MDALKFVSIADEKVVRVFEAPEAFVQLTRNLQVAEIDADEVNSSLPFYYLWLNQVFRARDQLERRFRR